MGCLTIYTQIFLSYSDNAWSFVAGCNFIQQVHVADEFKKYFSTFNIKHLTIPHYSAWFENVWLHLVKTVKCCLYKLVGRQKLCYFELLSVLSDIQNVLNSHPLTYQCSEDAGLDIISPNTFIQPHSFYRDLGICGMRITFLG